MKKVFKPARSLTLAMSLASVLMLSACGDQPPPEAAQAPVEPRRAVSADEQTFRDAVIASVTTIDPELASQTRTYYRAMDAGERSRAAYRAPRRPFAHGLAYRDAR